MMHNSYEASNGRPHRPAVLHGTPRSLRNKRFQSPPVPLLVQFRRAMIREVADAQSRFRSVERAAGPVVDGRQLARAFDTTLKWLQSPMALQRRRQRQENREREQWLREQEEQERDR